MINASRLVVVATVGFGLWGAACGSEPGPATDPPAVVALEPCPDPPPCGDDCSNLPYVPTDCLTTPDGPAAADVVPSDSTMLFCDAGTYALCFFSGPAVSTGRDPGRTTPLPCTLSEDGTSADCTCQAYTASASEPMFVAMAGILNEGAYFETVQACGPNGSLCKNMPTCLENPNSPECRRRPYAPVCQYVAGQNPRDSTTSLIPGADLISTFSFAMATDYAYRPQTSCTTTPGAYAGCMTAPCSASGDRPLADGTEVQCDCPVTTGPFQVGQPGQSCDLGDAHVWSASYTPPAPMP